MKHKLDTLVGKITAFIIQHRVEPKVYKQRAESLTFKWLVKECLNLTG